MSENEIYYQKLEELWENGTAPEDVGDPEMSADLKVLHILADHAEVEPMPRSTEFTSRVMGQVRRRRQIWPVLAMAAAFVLAVGSIFLNSENKSAPEAGGEIMIDDQLFNDVMADDTRISMRDHLLSMEKLLISLREVDTTCTIDQVDFQWQKEMAKDLLFKQKLFASQIKKPEFYQARSLFGEIEKILVDINTMDMCSDKFEVDFINNHISEERLLMKLRILAQDIQHS